MDDTWSGVHQKPSQIHANLQYAHILLPPGVETTVNIRDLAPHNSLNAENGDEISVGENVHTESIDVVNDPMIMNEDTNTANDSDRSLLRENNDNTANDVNNVQENSDTPITNQQDIVKIVN